MEETVKPGQNLTGDLQFWVKFAGTPDALLQAATDLGLSAELVSAGVEAVDRGGQMRFIGIIQIPFSA